ncbi:MAG: GNAT family N-acetyltransferase [Planctomycetes bacterium]|nr:GNAT family N-acetyltransferase [Planctomycetota bacterium]
MHAAVTVRPARAEDLAQLVRFNLAMARETEDKHLDPARLENGVARVLADPARGRYFVAERAGSTVGALLVTTEWSDWRDGWFWWLQSVYVVPEGRRTGVYRTLHEHVVRAARDQREVCGVRLYVDRENRSAQAVYQRLGMDRARYEFFEIDFVLGR